MNRLHLTYHRSFLVRVFFFLEERRKKLRERESNDRRRERSAAQQVKAEKKEKIFVKRDFLQLNFIDRRQPRTFMMNETIDIVMFFE